MRWEELGKLCSIKSGGTPSRKQNDFWRGEIPWAKISDLDTPDGGPLKFTEERISNQGLEAIRNRIFPVGTILLAIYGSVGKTAVLGVESSCNQAILGIQIEDANALDAEYLLFWLRSIGEKLMSQAKGVAQKNISLKQVKELKIPVPPLEEQRRIAGILDEADLVRKKSQALIDKYDELAQSLFLDMFGDPVTNPKGWEVVKLREVVHEDSDLSYGIVQPGNYVENGVPMVRPVDFTQRIIRRSTCKTIAPEIAESFMRTKLKGGELLITVRGTVGLIAQAHSDLSGGNVSRGVVPLFLKENHECDSEFMTSLFQNVRFNSYVNRTFVKGATLKGWNLKDLRMLEIYWPTLKNRREWFKCITSIQAQQSQAALTLLDNEGMFKSLLQKAFKGELS